MGEAMLPSGATMLRSRACVHVMVGLGTGRWLALDIRLYRDNTERFHLFQTVQLLFPRAAFWRGRQVCWGSRCVRA